MWQRMACVRLIQLVSYAVLESAVAPLAQHGLVPNGSASTKALDYSPKRWVVPTRYMDGVAVPNWCSRLATFAVGRCSLTR